MDKNLQEALALLEGHPDYRVLTRAGAFTAQPDYKAPLGLDTREVVILDTETTGLDTQSAFVVELGMVRACVNASTGALLAVRGVFSALEDPGIPMPTEAAAVHGITDAELKGKRIDDDEVLRFVEGADLIVAHQAEFDAPMASRRWPALAAKTWGCSLQEPAWEARGFTGKRLEWLAFQLGLFHNAHRAADDCLALLDVLTQPSGPHGTFAMRELFEPRTAYRIFATGAPFEVKDVLKNAGYRWMVESTVSPKTWALPGIEGDEALEAALAWLHENGYRGRRATVLIETMKPSVRYFGQPGEIIRHQFG